jgi:hypothetical protein
LVDRLKPDRNAVLRFDLGQADLQDNEFTPNDFAEVDLNQGMIDAIGVIHLARAVHWRAARLS